MIHEAFFSICKEAKPATANYVSLYASVPYYGGPEEGGWWGRDVRLIAYHCFDTTEQAMVAIDQINELVRQMNADEKRAFGEQCLREMEWLEARGLDADYLPEPDGETTYFICSEDTLGSRVSNGPRHYE